MSKKPAPNPLADLTRVEDYLEVVYDLIKEKGYARSSDIAERLTVKSPSVTRMLQKLNSMGLIEYERYRGIALTDKGEEQARFIQQKHATIVMFLQILGIEEKTAKLDAEGIEHHVHKVTLNHIEQFVEFANEHPSWFKTFKDACS